MCDMFYLLRLKIMWKDCISVQIEIFLFLKRKKIKDFYNNITFSFYFVLCLLLIFFIHVSKYLMQY